MDNLLGDLEMGISEFDVEHRRFVICGEDPTEVNCYKITRKFDNKSIEIEELFGDWKVLDNPADHSAVARPLSKATLDAYLAAFGFPPITKIAELGEDE